jgi:hypothetical protein
MPVSRGADDKRHRARQKMWKQALNVLVMPSAISVSKYSGDALTHSALISPQRPDGHHCRADIQEEPMVLPHAREMPGMNHATRHIQ